MTLKKHLVALVSIFFIIGATFWFLPQSFFQQDEWVIFSNMIYTKLTQQNYWGVILPQAGLSHFIPLTRIMTRLMFDVFGLTFLPYVVLAIMVHGINSFLVYVLGTLTIKRFWPSLLGAILFATNANTHQATTWFATTIGTQGCATFLLLSLIFFFRYLNTKKTSDAIVSSFSWIVSLGFKENSFFLIFLFPLLLFVQQGKQILKYKPLLISMSCALLMYVSIRTIIAFTAPPPPGEPTAYEQPGTATYAFRIVMLPVRTFVQTVVPTQHLLSLSRGLIGLAYPQFLVNGKTPDPYIVDSVAVDIVQVFAFFVFLFFMYRRENLFWLLYIPLSTLLLIFVGGRAGYASLFEPRNLYYPAIGLALLISGIVKRKPFLVFVVLFLVAINVRFIRTDLRVLRDRSGVRKTILREIQSTYPILPKKVVFYTESDTPYYGMAPEETIMPFQSGFGQTLLVWYAAAGQSYPVCFFDYHEDFLYALQSQGYKQCQEFGFGYFRKYNDLVNAVKDNNLSADSVIAFSWNGNSRTLLNITDKIRKTIK